jgi:hypothetical protein
MSINRANKSSISVVAIRAGILTVGLWALWLLPSKIAGSHGSGLAGYLMSIAFQFLIPGTLVTLFIHGYPNPESTSDIVLFQMLIILFNWLFYFIVFLSVSRLSQQAKRSTQRSSGK